MGADALALAMRRWEERHSQYRAERAGAAQYDEGENRFGTGWYGLAAAGARGRLARCSRPRALPDRIAVGRCSGSLIRRIVFDESASTSSKNAIDQADEARWPRAVDHRVALSAQRDQAALLQLPTMTGQGRGGATEPPGRRSVGKGVHQRAEGP